MVKLFIGGFPLDFTELELVQLIDPHAMVSTIKIVRDKATRKCKGYAFLEVEDIGGADRVIDALDGTMIGDRVLTINKVEGKNAKPEISKPYVKTPIAHGNSPKPKRPRIVK